MTPFSHRNVDNLSKERLDQGTDFRVMSSHLGQGASGAADKNFAIHTFNSRLAAKARKKFDCLLEPLFKRARISRSMRLRHSMTDFTQNRFELLRAKALFYLGKNSVEERAVGLWKQFLALRRQFVRKMRFAKARTLAGLAHQAVALQCGEVRAHGVIRQTQSHSQFCHRARLST